MGKKARFNFFLTLMLACIAFACQSSNIEKIILRDFSNIQLEWIPQSPDISVAEYSEERLLIHCVKINLENPSIRIKMLPQFPAEKNIHVKNYARHNSLAAAFNTTPFLADGILKNKKTPCGICIKNKQIVSKPLASYCALGFFKTPQGFAAKIFERQNDAELQQADYAAGGFWQILKNGEIVQFEEIRDSRLFCAISNEGKTLFVFAVEGENKNKSAGLTYMECAQFAKSLGISNAMQFDGGSSTALVVNEKSLLTYKNKVKVPACIGFSFQN